MDYNRKKRSAPARRGDYEKPGENKMSEPKETKQQGAADAGSRIHRHKYEKRVVEPTCLEQGYTLHVCACGDEYRDEYTKLADHRFEEKSRTPAACTEDVRIEYVCAICRKKKIETIPAKGHTFGEWVPTERPTCTGEGEEARECLTCGAIEKRPLPPIGHDFTEWEPSETDPKREERFCRRCNLHEFRRKNNRSLIRILSLLIPFYPIYVYRGKKIPKWRKKFVRKVYFDKRVTSIGEEHFSECFKLTSIVIPEGVTSIGNYAFSYCTGLTSVTIPDNVTSIGEGVFNGCSSLQKMTVPFIGDKRKTDSDPDQYPFGYFFGTAAYSGGVATEQFYFGADRKDSKQTSSTYYIPASLKSVTVTGGSVLLDAFQNCSGLTAVTFGREVEDVREHVFFGCTGLTSLAVEKGNPIYHSSGNCVINTKSNKLVCGCANSVIPSDGSVTVIGWGSFSGQSTMTSVKIPAGVVEIQGVAFYYCAGLTSITIPDSVTSIGESAFWGCSSLQSMTVPFVGDKRKTASDPYQYPFGYIFGTGEYSGGVATVQCYLGEAATNDKQTSSTYYIPASLKSVTVTGGNILFQAFENCSGLTAVTFGRGVEDVREHAFPGCTGLTTLKVEKGNSVYHSSGNCVIETKSKMLVCGCKNSEIPSDGSVTVIGWGAFSGQSTMTSVKIPAGVVEIQGQSFHYCAGLTSITIPNSVTSIGGSAFRGCSGLTSITFQGTEEQWNAIAKGSDWDGDTGNYTVHYTGETIPTVVEKTTGEKSEKTKR